MIIGCADSRVDPATIFSAGPGELFIVRNVAALVPPYEESGTYHGTSAALEFAVCVLAVSNIVVLGHGMCGGVEAALAGAARRPVGRFIAPWVGMLSAVYEDVFAEEGMSPDGVPRRTLEQIAVRQSLQNLMSFSFVADAVGVGALTLEGAWFSIAEGELMWLDQDTDQFERVPD